MGLDDRQLPDERDTLPASPHAHIRTRDALRPAAWWDEQILRTQAEADLLDRALAAGPQTEDDVHHLARLSSLHMDLLRMKYSRGDLVSQLRGDFDQALDGWERAEAARDLAWSPQACMTVRSWAVNIDHYIDSFWFVGLALAFRIDEASWARLVRLVGNEGEDGLLDAVIASRQPRRAIGRSFCYPQPYGRLWEASQMPRGFRAPQLARFLADWYNALATAVSCARQAQETFLRKPSWMGRHAPGIGVYCGYWSIEAVAAAVGLRMDDRSCLGHPHYPGDLIRPVLVTEPDLSRMPFVLAGHIVPRNRR
ncbi:MAG: DUF1911 domain-containing protein [Comamonadaceae bacterium]|nr:MAG: DUF1911 domain-containing protein [Comamonadaceae bacterium]